MIKKLLVKYNSLSCLVKAGIWFTLCNFLQKGISFLVMPIFTRIMTTEEYGQYSVYNSWYSMVTIFATLHLSYYVFNKGLVKYEEDQDQFVVSIQSLSATLTASIFILYILFRDIINMYIGMTTTMMVCMMVQLLFEPSILYWTARKRFEYDYRAVVFITLLISFLNPALGIIVIKIGLFSNAALGRAFSITAITLIFGVFFMIQIIKSAKKVHSVKYWKYALNFNLPLIPHYLSTTILSSADRIMIERMCGATKAAIYSVAYSVGMCGTLFSQAIHQTLLPWLYKKMKNHEYNRIPQVTSTLLFVMLGIVLVLMCFAPEIIYIVGSSSYQEAVYVMPPVCGSVFFIFLQNVFANFEYYFEKTKLIAVASVGVAVANVILNYLCIQIWGYIAAGYTTLICYILYATIHYFVLKRICRNYHLDIHKIINKKIVLFTSTLTVGIIVIVAFLYHSAFLRYAVIGVVLVLCVLYRKRLIDLYKQFKKIEQ